MSVLQKAQAVQVICDLRHFNKDVDTTSKMQSVWQQINNQLVGKPIVPESPLEIKMSEGKVTLWIVDNRGLKQVEQDTAFEIVDILRNPTLLYRCKVCGSYGPLRCIHCEKDHCPDGQERLCTNCAYFIKDSLSAYCPSHIPQCQCSSSCKQRAEFACHHCSRSYDLKAFGAHFRKLHPQDPDQEYCQRCYSLLFERCEVCNKLGKKRSLGKQRCVYRSRPSDQPCNLGLCWEHGVQWKIWGKYPRGLPFCPQHRQLLGQTDPAAIILMIITTKPPPHSTRLNIYRLRHAINRDRAVPITFKQLGSALNSLANVANSWDDFAQKRYQTIMHEYNEAIAIIPQQYSDLLRQIKTFYSRVVGQEAAAQIVGLEIVDCFSKGQGQPNFVIDLHIKTSQAGRFIGEKGKWTQGLREQLRITGVEFWDVSSGRPVSLKKR